MRLADDPANPPKPVVSEAESITPKSPRTTRFGSKLLAWLAARSYRRMHVAAKQTAAAKFGLRHAVLLLVNDHLPCESIHLQFVAHFLNERRLLVELRRQGINLFLLLLHFAMCFEKFVE